MTVRPVEFFKYFQAIAVILFITSLVAIFLKKVFLLDNFTANSLYFFFNMGSESNIPTLFSVIILFLASTHLYVAWKTNAGDKTKNYWIILAAIFLFLAIDEGATIHEQFNKYGRNLGGGSGYLYYSWIIPYTIFALFAGIYFLRFLLMLPLKTRKLFIISGVLYVTAAIGFEIPEGHIVDLYGRGTFQDELLCSIEELIEMTSIIVFNYSLLDYMAERNTQAFVAK